MGPVAAVTSAHARIAILQARFDGSSSRVPLDPFAGGVPTTADGTPVGFDPFGEAYQQAVAAVAARPSSFAATPDVGSAASQGAPGGHGSIQVAPELAVHGNGQIPIDALEPIGQGSHRLWGPAAVSWRAAVEAAAADGIELRITDSYRSYDEQVDLARRKGLYSEGGLAAVPGTSNHGWGLAVDADVTDPSTLAWLRANAGRFGFVEAVPREPWHWEYRPAA